MHIDNKQCRGRQHCSELLGADLLIGDTQFFNTIQPGRTQGRERVRERENMEWRGWDGQNSITEDSCTASLHYLTPCPANDITISCKGCSHYPPSSTNRRNISTCLFQPTRNTDMIQTANSSVYCRYGNCILSSLLPWGASFNSITEPEETASQRLYSCKSVLRPTTVCFSVKLTHSLL